MQPKFLGLAEVLLIHQDQINRYGGEPGIRDLGLLKSAIATPAATFNGEYLHTDISEMAAAYLFHLVKNHPFIDGNKRVGTVAAIIFLKLNSYDFTAAPEKLTKLVIKLASGEISKAEVVMFVERWRTEE
jgi:death-on-curing protein